MKSTLQPHPSGGARPLAAIILAAGRGTRMPGDLPKVAHKVADRAMVEWVVDAARAVGAAPIALVVGYRQDVLRSLLAGQRDVHFVEQREQMGTAHAVESARESFKDFDGDVLVLCGDGPLIRTETLKALVDRHRTTNAATTLATSTIHDPTGYGRIVRDAKGSFDSIVEHRVATPEQRRIREVNPSYYCFQARGLFDTLRRVARNAMSGEYYVTDVPGLQKQRGDRVEIIEAVPAEDVLSINTQEQLREVDAILTARMGACR